MTTLHFSGFPRVGAFRELKFAQENTGAKRSVNKSCSTLPKTCARKTGNTKLLPTLITLL
ncbi:5-methyltetrahydropteroyltriglutamate/homocysteine S-methyltransferase [Neisseria gonorrhoeae]|uniref:5-methyltetrahydropteroyltriglutamate/homocysteine S-methyltransferase n=1 Tax=Neisseria gonorrhoeae TaxID=485 RepID=A0A378VY69_NEIGO|nr:5-methyltetrahydropteroyltriglutamate/homocysteine S-methyltransferase [Neisseria gonorrhoeae]